MKTYVTFGQSHTHSISGKTVDKDCVAVIKCKDAEEGRKLAFELFGDKFCFEYPEEYFNPDIMIHFPRGYVEIN